ncbi:hypothetical protein ACFRAQ_34570 [Nocardia sp. NPDC056611]|uniref:hypothetical protein n=1 Tax=Nocardia sp. NPDC056611 TaxID=3345877 RepID=UPI00366F0E34
MTDSKFTIVRVGENPYATSDKRAFVVTDPDGSGEQYGVTADESSYEYGVFRNIRTAALVDLPQVEKIPGTTTWHITNGSFGSPRIPEKDLDSFIEVGRVAMAAKTALEAAAKLRSPEQLTADLTRLANVLVVDPANKAASERLRAALAEGRVKFE